MRIANNLAPPAPPPSRVYLPAQEPAPGTLIEFLIARFPRISPGVWRDRFDRGRIVSAAGDPLPASAPYRAGAFVFYWREVPAEPPAPEAERIIYRDANILVADKPHGMPVTPAGDYVERALCIRLHRSTGADGLAPMHRLDRDTAGLVLFSVQPKLRARYHRLFAEGRIEREYLALAHLPEALVGSCWQVEGRIQRGQPWYRQQMVSGAPNAATDIELLASEGGVGLFRIRPRTGKKHQIRIHMASIGCPIVGDRLYPQSRDMGEGEPSLQLLARRLSFIDPLTGDPRTFVSKRELSAARDCGVGDQRSPSSDELSGRRLRTEKPPC